MIVKYLIFVLLIASTNLFAKDVYTCTVGGKTVYQGKPCAGSKEQINKIKEKQNSYHENESRKVKEKAERDARKEPKIGMTTTQVGNSTWGYPQRYSETQSVNGLSEFWHYDSGKMVYFKNGVVVSLTK